MSSQVALQREESDAAVTTNPRNTRPFSGSDPPGGDLLTVLVHFGRHLDALVSKEPSTEVESTAVDPEKLNTYVVASVGAFAGSSDRVRCHRGYNTTGTSVLALEGRVLYEQACSPYAATRVVEGSTSPLWNELLAIPLPTGWLNASKQLLDLGGKPASVADAAVGSHLALKIELVERGASHQEDFLLGTCVIPLAETGCHLQQARFALGFPSAEHNLDSPASIYASLCAINTSPLSMASILDHVEITVESFTPVVVTGSEDEELLDCTNLAALINLDTGCSTNSFTFERKEKHEVLENHFTFVQDGHILPEFSTSTVNAPKAGVTPSASSTTGRSSGVYEWFFPLCFAVPVENNHDFSVPAVNIGLFKNSSVPYRLVGRGQLQLSSTTAQQVKKDGSSCRHTVIPITLHGDTSRVLGHIALRLRWWNAAAWETFIDDTPVRRVVCTNRWKHSPRLVIAWMGALLRGLNRYPVASICDAGGVSSVLAQLLAEPSSCDETAQKPQRVHTSQHHQNLAPQSNSKAIVDTNELLREQLVHLHAEGAAQRLQIQRLQNELDTRLAAIKTCGLEIMVLRREARQNDGQLQHLREQVEVAQRHEQQQRAELLVSTSSNGSTFSTHPEHQAASHRFTLLVTKYKELDHEYQAVKQQLANAQQSLNSYADLETRHIKLQEAHHVQSALIQRLQRDKQHAAVLKKAVRMQEKVIRQFEQTVAQQSTEIPDRSTQSQHAPTEQLEIANSSDTREGLLHVRVQVLEQQLQTNARDAATEISALRMRILELETVERRRTGK